MQILIIGGSGSGKSKFAEAICMQLEPKKKIYLATMMSSDAEMKKRIQNHREMRKGKEFITMEQGLHIGNIEPNDTSLVLLECMSNLLANERYHEEGHGQECVVDYVVSEVEALLRKVNHLVLVTNDIFSEKQESEEMQKYQRELGQINQRLAKQSDVVIEVVFGLPIIHKGKDIYENLS